MDSPRKSRVAFLLSPLLALGCGGGADMGVASATLAAAPEGTVLLDAAAYRAPGTVTITVADTNVPPRETRRGATARITSPTTPKGVALALGETTPGIGIFRGTVRLALTATHDALRVRDGDTLTVTYDDADDGTGQRATATATARVDDTSADLTVTAVSGPEAALAGASITVSKTIANDPLGGGTVDFDSVLYLSRTPSFDRATAVALLYIGEGSYAAGEVRSDSWQTTLPPWLPGGVYYYVAEADDGGLVPELDETNNARVGNQVVVTGIPLADLAVTALGLDAATPALLAPGDMITISDTVANAPGGQPAYGPPSFPVCFFLSPTPGYRADGTAVRLGTRDVPTLAAGESSTGTTALALPEGVPDGTYSRCRRACPTGPTT
jgi:hypothetical protein